MRPIAMTARASNLSVTALGFGVLVLVGGAVWFGLGTTDAPPAKPDVTADVDDTMAAITVHVSGAVRDPGVVMVPASARVMDVVIAAGGATRIADLTKINLAATVTDGERVVVPIEGQAETVIGADNGVDLNTATAPGLEGLPGVGPVLAARIVGYREEHGPFSTVEDLLDVSGIGEAKLAAMRDAISSP